MLRLSAICRYPFEMVANACLMAPDDKDYMEGYKGEGENYNPPLSNKVANLCNLQFIFP